MIILNHLTYRKIKGAMVSAVGAALIIGIALTAL